MRRFLSEHKVLEPLHLPVILQVIYKPPLVSWEFYKDLDNIMRWILPIFNEIFKAPPTYLSKLDPAIVPDERLKKMICALPKNVPYSVAGYEIMEIPRKEGDEPQGFITIGITGGLTYQNLWNRVEDIIKELHNCLKN
jgi:hypothetical protein